ncbi:RES family NAD+ phosphorylase [Photobacterium alginatilyticum]|uniref:RES family NAD+ phosphorylase n=1 Tax=Photobacterium alginatilyticum TaxID=1775171 RepID=UPI004067FEDB
MMYICKDCVEVGEVKKEVERLNIGQEVCCYCDSKSIVAPKESVFSFIENNFFEAIIPIDECSPQESSSFWGGSDDLYVKEIWEIIHDIGLKNEVLESDLSSYLSQKIGVEDKLFTLNDGTLENNLYQDRWLSFIDSISHGKRFFNFEVSQFLDDLFSVIHKKNHVNDDICTVLEPNVSLFRARIANSKIERESIISDPANELGPVPAKLASDQRMTPNGISAFYASSDRETCFSEVRAITGDLVISGEFTVNRPLKFLDLRKIEELSKKEHHPFEQNFLEKSHKSHFLKRLMFLLSKPASKRKNSNYLETQVIFEYFRVNFGSDISGLIFSSVQTGLDGLNVVLFPERSNVNSFTYNTGRKIVFREWPHQEGDFYTYSEKFSEKLPPQESEANLSFVNGSLELHYIEAVKTVARKQNILVIDNVDDIDF